MSKRQQQTAFLKALILHGNVDERAQLQEQIKRAERDELCAWRALWLVSVLAVFSCCGICYSAVLIPEFFQNSSNVVVKVFCGLGLASLICTVTFLGFWMWCRGVLNRVQQVCRRYVMATLQPNGRTNLVHVLPATNGQIAKTPAVIQSTGPEHGDAVRPAYQTYSQLFSFRRTS
jgi:hypothetical protein